MDKPKKLPKDDGFYRFDDPFIYQVRTNGTPYTRSELRKSTMDWLAETMGFGSRGRAVVDKNSGTTVHIVNNLLSNYHWYQIGRPYCKVGPMMAELMGKTKINLPKDKVLMPFPSFEICFPKSSKNPLHDGKGGPCLRAMKVEGMFRFDEHEIAIFDSHQYMNLILDFGDMINDGKHNYHYYHYFNVKMDTPGTMEEAFVDTIARGGMVVDGGYQPPAELVHRILAMTICTTFFMTNQHEQVMPDIPRRYLELHRRLSGSRRPDDVRQLKDLMDRLKEMDHFGFQIKEYELPRPDMCYSYDGGRAGTGMQLEWSHVRGAHGAWRWVGPRNNPDLKWVFIQPTVVRPDLPFNPARVIGYRVNDEVLAT